MSTPSDLMEFSYHFYNNHTFRATTELIAVFGPYKGLYHSLIPVNYCEKFNNIRVSSIYKMTSLFKTTKFNKIQFAI